MTFNRFTAAGLSGTVDNTLALANLSFDFSLFRVEAPPAYKELGRSLSTQRSREAESGSSHITARKLGALFGEIIPTTPALIDAYGLRVSEIAKSPEYNPKGDKEYGVFADQIGADGTTIWAAATSGTSALAVHLLPCMLARIWPGPEATSIWVEIVNGRKQALSESNVKDSLHVPFLSPAEINLSRDQLAKWDASARAWLLTADSANEHRQKQLMLILNNLGIPVGESSSTYDSVISAWKTAMLTVDKLVTGVPQSVRKGSALLGLSAWHLYPNMLVLGRTTKTVAQNDGLIAFGGLLTLGLEESEARRDGIFWSLPLAHMRYYGDPVVVRSSLHSDASRISIDQFLLVALGSLLGCWRTKYTDLEAAAGLIVDMWHTISSAVSTETTVSNWLRTLADAAQSFVDSSGDYRRECLQLVKAGRRRYFNLLGGRQNLPLPYFGLSTCQVFFDLLCGVEERIWLLREVASQHPKGSQRMVIQYMAEKASVIKKTYDFECTTAVAVENSVAGTKRKREQSHAASNRQHIRWIAGFGQKTLEQRMKELSGTGERIMPMCSAEFMPLFDYHEGLSWRSEDEAPLLFLNTYLGEGNFNPQFGSIRLRLVYGDPLVAALYAFEDVEIKMPNEVKLPQIKQALARGFVPAKNLESFLSFGRHIKSSAGDTRCGPLTLEHARSLQALESAVSIYRTLPQATIALGVASKPLHEAKWMEKVSTNDLQPCRLNQEQVFACIIMFESGSFNIDPKVLNHVMAMSTGNSIYVASPLLSDPWEVTQCGKIHRVIGNIGRPGIALMIPPQRPRIRKLEPDTWTCITHEDFNGESENSFQQTTLHLSFSGWERPVDIDHHGAQDDPIYFLEAPISILDGGKWMADLDILRTFRASDFCRVKTAQCSGCHHRDNLTTLVSIDRWEELIERPIEAGVVRARGNWQARLAATALSVQQGHNTVVLPKDFCWKCPMEVTIPEGHADSGGRLEDAQEEGESNGGGEENTEEEWDELGNESEREEDIAEEWGKLGNGSEREGLEEGSSTERDIQEQETLAASSLDKGWWGCGLPIYIM